MFNDYKMPFLIWLSLILKFQLSFGLVDYCDVDKIQSCDFSTGIQFTKELSTWEYGVLSSFRSLHCCAKGYRSIEWFKDGKAYPWAADESSFILYPESANQTIYSQAIGAVDTGNYTCIVANDSKALSHTVSLTVFDTKKNYMNTPLETYELPGEQFLQLGKTARLYCEAFVGKIDLPDAESDVWWERTGFNMSSPEARRYQQKSVHREEGQVVGAYLTIESLRMADLGEYVCSISNTEDQVLRQATILREMERKDEPRDVVLSVIYIVIFVIVMQVLHFFLQRFALTGLLYLKLKFSPRTLDDGKEYDVLVCYSSHDADFALAVLATTLQSRYNYKVSVCKIYSAGVSAELQLAASSSRCLLAVYSQALLENNGYPKAFSSFFKELAAIHPKTLCVTQEYNVIGDCAAAVEHLLSPTTVLYWHDKTPAQRRVAWTRLRLNLPIPLSAPSTSGSQTTEETTSTKAELSTFAKPSESSEDLV